MLRKQKRGMEVNLNWIFIIAVAAVFIFFFIKVIGNQGELYSKRTENDMAMGIRVLASSAQSKAGTASLFQGPSTIYASCSGLSGKGLDRTVSFGSRPVFSPSFISSTTGRYIAFTSQFLCPFEADELLYITSTTINYEFVDSALYENKIKYLAGMLPLTAKAKVISNTDLSSIDGNYGIHRIIIFGNGISVIPESLISPRSSALVIAPNSDGTGMLDFYTYVKSSNNFEKTGDSLFYLDNSTLLAAVISDSNELYECNLAKALTRLSIISSLYANRARTLSEYYNNTYPINYDCRNLFIYAGKSFDDISSAASAISITPSDSASITDISEAKKNLEKSIAQAESISCATLS